MTAASGLSAQASINQAVKSWLEDAPGAAKQIDALTRPAKIEALDRLGYNTPCHLAMFGIDQ